MPPASGPAALQQRFGHRFAQPDLLQQALTHRSFSATHYERLEFLGDAVLNLAVSDWLYRQLPDCAEGELSRIRAQLVRQDALHRIALQWDLPPQIRLGEGELRSGGRERPSILADVVEAILGAVYLDAGYEAARAVVHGLYAATDLAALMRNSAKDPKTGLQEWLQQRRLPLPAYTVLGTQGAAHQQVFEVACEIPRFKLCVTGKGASRRAAEQAAAQAAQAALAGLDGRR